ncbi:hypothetical protein DFS33DRAFT_1298058 [Desarmillaria ectypa]|nr:hypothetical protein DFS33DRAFT_1298058 [Desarmillaria ectypa]
MQYRLQGWTVFLLNIWLVANQFALRLLMSGNISRVKSSGRSCFCNVAKIYPALISRVYDCNFSSGHRVKHAYHMDHLFPP